MDQATWLALRESETDQAERKALFDTGENVGDSWKHRIWRNLTLAELQRIARVAQYYYSCNRDQTRRRVNADGTYDFEAVYGCEGNGQYSIEEWDGTVLLGPNRRALAEKWPVGCFVLYEVRGKKLVGWIKRHNRKTMSITQTGHVTIEAEGAVSWTKVGGRRQWWRIPWGLVDETIIRAA